MRIGIVGLPNVGKSTLFNALTKQRAPAANFPFTTVDPNVGVVTVPDERLEALAHLSQSKRVVPTTIEVVDIAGLVQGAHRGEGLGNQFLAHIREVDAIAEVIRCFPNPQVTHVSGMVDPRRDVEVIHTELALADLQTLENMLEREERAAKSGDPELTRRVSVLRRFRDALAAGQAVRIVELTDVDTRAIKDVRLLTQKPILYVANLDEEQLRRAAEAVAPLTESYTPVVPLSIKIEQELTELSPDDHATFLKEYNLAHSGLDDLIRAAYDLLGLITFFTTGPDETRAWTVRRGAKAPEAAGKIHSDFERGFIRVETIAWRELVEAGGYTAATARGLVRHEGKDYVVQDGDVCIFKTHV